MEKAIHSGRSKASALGKKGAGRSAYVMKPESLALVENFRLMDDTFMSKCLENAPECIELILQIIIGKKDLKVISSQTEYPIKSLQGRGVRFDVFARDSKGREYDIGKLMHDFLCSNAAEMYFDILKRHVSQFKNSDEGRHYMCKVMERIEARGKREGKRETMLATAKRMLKSGMLALKDIAKFSGLSLAQVKKLQAEMA